jgi:hypothetical protein
MAVLFVAQMNLGTKLVDLSELTGCTDSSDTDKPHRVREISLYN